MAYEEDTYGIQRIKDLRAENERLRAGIAAFVDAWDNLPVGRHSIDIVQDWINSKPMRSAVFNLKRLKQQKAVEK